MERIKNNGWISVKDALPTKNDVYLTYQKYRNIGGSTCGYVYDLCEFDADSKHWLFIDPLHDVEFWQPLPNPPETK